MFFFGVADYVQSFAKPEDLSFKASNKPAAEEEKDNDLSDSQGFLTSSDDDDDDEVLHGTDA